jgi:hypothetical protein
MLERISAKMPWKSYNPAKYGFLIARLTSAIQGIIKQTYYKTAKQIKLK